MSFTYAYKGFNELALVVIITKFVYIPYGISPIYVICPILGRMYLQRFQ
jgi:hypothetical protein